MIPLRDTIPAKNYPVITTAIIGANILIYLLQLVQGSGLDRFIYTYGLVPARYTAPEVRIYFSSAQQLLSFVSFMFLHGGFWHILGNMWSLYIFGDNVEDRLGPFRYLVFYLLCGITSGLAHLLTNPHSNVPTIGASGAIAGVMGAYFILHPKAKILTLIPIIIIPYFVEIPAYFFLGIWFVLQFINAAGSQADVSGIAWWAHIGGFIGGMIWLKIFLALPQTGVSNKVRRVTEKRTTPRLQTIRPVGLGDDPNLYATINVSPHEVRAGTRKLVNLPTGFKKRLFRVTVPPGIKDGSMLRLRGLGKVIGTEQRGDLLLKVAVKSTKSGS